VNESCQQIALHTFFAEADSCPFGSRYKVRIRRPQEIAAPVYEFTNLSPKGSVDSSANLLCLPTDLGDWDGVLKGHRACQESGDQQRP
jgi:hypothetical protein